MNWIEVLEWVKEVFSCVDEFSGVNGIGCWIRLFWKMWVVLVKWVRECSDFVIVNKLFVI